MWSSAATASYLVFICSHVWAYPTCTDSQHRYVGYTYSFQQTHKVWSHCNFFKPSPTSLELCGLTHTWQDVHICDPDGLLYYQNSNSSAVTLLGDTLQSFIDTLSRDCPDKKSPTESVIVGLLAVDAIQVPDTQNGQLCENECGELRPTHNNVKEATAEERQTGVDNFISSIITREWKVGKCNNQIVILYVAEQKKLWLHFGPWTLKRFGQEVVDKMSVSMQEKVEAANTTGLGDAMVAGVDILVTNLSVQKMNASSPAIIILIVFMACLLLLSAILALIFYVVVHVSP